jgi:hypothetical protein
MEAWQPDAQCEPRIRNRASTLNQRQVTEACRCRRTALQVRHAIQRRPETLAAGAAAHLHMRSSQKSKQAAGGRARLQVEGPGQQDLLCSSGLPKSEDAAALGRDLLTGLEPSAANVARCRFDLSPAGPRDLPLHTCTELYCVESYHTVRDERLAVQGLTPHQNPPISGRSMLNRESTVELF